MTDPLQDPGVQGLAQLGRNAIERVAQLEHWLGNLLAVIHRDGGHYESEHGTEKACADAETAVHVLRGSLEGYVEANRHMKGELDDALEDARKYAEAKGEIARLWDELARVAAPARSIAAHAADAMTAKDIVISALLDTLRQWKYAEDNNDRDELANARTNRDEALAQVAEVGR